MSGPLEVMYWHIIQADSFQACWITGTSFYELLFGLIMFIYIDQTVRVGSLYNTHNYSGNCMARCQRVNVLAASDWSVSDWFEFTFLRRNY